MTNQPTSLLDEAPDPTKPGAKAAAKKKPAAKAKPPAKAKPAAPKPETDPEAGDHRPRRGRLAIPRAGTNEKINHADVVAPEVLAEHDEADDTRADRAAAILREHDYSGAMTTGLLRALQPLLDEPINPRYIVTTGPADRGKPIVTTGIISVQVQVDRLAEVLGLAHFRLLPHHTPDGTRCRMHVVLGNDLQWCGLTAAGELVPYTLLDNTVGLNGIAFAGVKHADVIAHADGWGGHARGSAPGDIWKGSETNAGKRVIARVGPGRHVYRLDFEDDPHQGQAPRERQAKQPAAKPAAPQVGMPETDQPIDHDKAIAQLLSIDDDLRDARKRADDAMQVLGASASRRHEELTKATTAKKLEDIVTRVNQAVDRDNQS